MSLLGKAEKTQTVEGRPSESSHKQTIEQKKKTGLLDQAEKLKTHKGLFQKAEEAENFKSQNVESIEPFDLNPADMQSPLMTPSQLETEDHTIQSINPDEDIKKIDIEELDLNLNDDIPEHINLESPELDLILEEPNVEEIQEPESVSIEIPESDSPLDFPEIEIDHSEHTTESGLADFDHLGDSLSFPEENNANQLSEPDPVQDFGTTEEHPDFDLDLDPEIDIHHEIDSSEVNDLEDSENKSNEAGDLQENEPQKNIFDEWEKEAEEDVQRIHTNKEHLKEFGEKKYLFDDESDFGTQPSEYFISSRRKVENHQALFEVFKEITKAENFESFFNTLVYSLMGQIGAASVVLFSDSGNEKSALKMVDYDGCDADPSWEFIEGDEVFSVLHEKKHVLYANYFLEGRLPEKEKEILEISQAYCLAPIMDQEKLRGIILIGKNLAETDYTTDDLEFLKLLGELTGTYMDRIQKNEENSENIDHLKKILLYNDSIFRLSRKIARARSMDETADIFLETMKDKFHVKRFTLLAFDQEDRGTYSVFTTNVIPPEKIGRFRLGQESQIVGIVSNIPGVYRIEDFRNDNELRKILGNDELSIMQEFVVLPLINLNWLVGMLIIHELEHPWTDTDREAIVSLLDVVAPVFCNVLIMKEQETLLRNPFNPLEKKIRSEIERSERLKIPFTLCIFKLQNMKRIINLFGADYFARACEYLRSCIRDASLESDFITSVGQGKFAVLYGGKSSEETRISIEKIRYLLEKFTEHKKEFPLSIQAHTLNYPTDTRDRNQFLSLASES